MRKFKKIILVDDLHATCIVGKKILDRMGLTSEVVVFHMAPQALHFLKHECEAMPETGDHPYLIFLDILMPEMNGLQFLQQLRFLPCFRRGDIFVVVMSAYNDIAQISEAGRLGAIYYLDKPLTQEKIQKMVERCFGEISI